MNLEECDVLGLSIGTWQISEVLSKLELTYGVHKREISIAYAHDWPIVHSDHATPLDGHVGARAGNSINFRRFGTETALEVC
jgi:hypothetical protein